MGFCFLGGEEKRRARNRVVHSDTHYYSNPIETLEVIANERTNFGRDHDADGSGFHAFRGHCENL